MVRRGTALFLLAAVACGSEVRRASPLVRFNQAKATGSSLDLAAGIATLRPVDKTVSFSPSTAKATAHPNRLSGSLPTEPFHDEVNAPDEHEYSQCGFPAIDGERECGVAHVTFACADQGRYWTHGIERESAQCPSSIRVSCLCDSFFAPRLT